MESQASTAFAARDELLYRQAGDTQSAFYKGMMELLRTCEANERRAKQMKKTITIPFSVTEREVTQLESQFMVTIRQRGMHNRARLTPRVSAMVHCLDSMLLELSSGGGRRVLLVDGDIATVAAIGVENKLVERTFATSRLAVGYSAEDDAVRRMATGKGGTISTSAAVVARELLNGGGEHYWPKVREDGPAVDTVVVNHFRTPIGANQVAWLARCRGATAVGCFPFQLEMMVADEGPLACFPGRFYVDREHDVITLVPDADATMSISHPYSSLLEIIHNNSVTVGGTEFLCEKFLSVKGVLFYTLRSVDAEFECPEVLRTSFYDAKAAAVTVLRYPYVKQSSEGIPVGWEVRELRMLTSRFERVMGRCRTLTSPVVGPNDVFKALMDYNNLVVNTLDTAVQADRMSVHDEEEAAVAIALYINYRRHQMKGTFNVLLDAVKKRHALADKSLVGFALVALSAWWSKPNVQPLRESEELPVMKIVDWCGNDFGVIASSADCWVDIEEEVGLGREKPGRLFPYFPRPKFSVGDEWYTRVLRCARRAVQRKRRSAASGVRRVANELLGGSKAAALEPELVNRGSAMVGEFSKEVVDEPRQLTALKQRLVAKLGAEQGAITEPVVVRELLVRDSVGEREVPTAPVIDVDPVNAIAADLEEMNGGPFERDAVTTGYRIAEVDVEANLDGNLRVNDAHRLIPGERWVRRPRVDAGVEGKRVASHAALFASVKKRNVGIPANRGAVNLDAFPDVVVQRFIDVCFREDWQEVLEKHLNTGLWEFTAEDIDQYTESIDEKKARSLLDEFFLEGEVDLSRWVLMAKGKIKPSREAEAQYKVDHSQTILYLENGSVNAAYSAMTKRFKKVLDEMLRPNVQINSQMNLREKEDWYNSLNSDRASRLTTSSYSVDAKSYDRAQDHVGLRSENRFYGRMGLNEERLRIWAETHGAKKAVSMMFKLVLTMTLGGVSGLWKTLLRNGLIMAMAVVYSTAITRQALVTFDVKGDDVDLEVDGDLDVEATVDQLCLSFNLSAKFFTNTVRYFCKQFWIWHGGRWNSMADPWARIQSICTPIWVGNHEDTLGERWESIAPELLHYDNGILVDMAAEAAQQYYGLPIAPYGIARSLARFAVDRGCYYGFFHAPERVN